LFPKPLIVCKFLQAVHIRISLLSKETGQQQLIFFPFYDVIKNVDKNIGLKNMQ